MPELALLTLDRQEAVRLHRAREKSDADALAFFVHVWDAYVHLWDAYKDSGLPCFLCDNDVEFPPHSEIAGDTADRDKVVAAPLCARCRQLPKMVKWGRCLKLLRAMHKARTGRNFITSTRRPTNPASGDSQTALLQYIAVRCGAAAVRAELFGRTHCVNGLAALSA